MLPSDVAAVVVVVAVAVETFVKKYLLFVWL